MSLRETVNEDIKLAMKARDSGRLATLRLLLSALKQIEVDERKTLTDNDVVAVIQKLCKQRRDSISQFEAGGRQDLADAEKQELAILSAYLPTQMSEQEINDKISLALTETGASSAADMGKIMAFLKPLVAGKADMALVSKLIKARLS